MALAFSSAASLSSRRVSCNRQHPDALHHTSRTHTHTHTPTHARACAMSRIQEHTRPHTRSRAYATHNAVPPNLLLSLFLHLLGILRRLLLGILRHLLLLRLQGRLRQSVFEGACVRAALSACQLAGGRHGWAMSRCRRARSERNPGADVAGAGPAAGTDVAGPNTVPVQMWQVRTQSRCRCCRRD
jgi:hypothetical protein